MTNGRKQGKHSAALPETQPAGARESVAKTGIMTNRELEEKFATKEELKQSENFLVEKSEHEKQLHSQQLQSVETNLTQKVEASEANLTQKVEASEANLTQKVEASEANLTQKVEASEANLTQKIDANEKRADEFRSDVNEQFKDSDARNVERIDQSNQLHSQELRSVETNLNQKIDANEARAAEFRSDMNEQFKDSDARNIERIAASEANLIQKIDANETNLTQKIDANEARAEERAKHLESTIEQQSEKNLYKTAFLVVVIGGSLSGLAYGLYQLAKYLMGF